MKLKNISGGTVHQLPDDIKQTILTNEKISEKWESLTPLARNEWICWVTFVKKDETRHEHLKRMVEDLLKGKRRPCCWMGCVHRKDKPISPSVKYILSKKDKAFK